MSPLERILMVMDHQHLEHVQNLHALAQQTAKLESEVWKLKRQLSRKVPNFDS